MRLALTLLATLAGCSTALEPVDATAPGRDAARPPDQDADLQDADLLVDFGLEPEDEGATPGDAGAELDAQLDAGEAAEDAAPPDPGCPLGAPCRPIVIPALPYVDEGDTRDAPVADWDGYACAPGTDESGGEVVYALDLAAPTTVRVEVDDAPGDGVDVDVHVLSALDPAACLARDNQAVERALPAGRSFIVVDTWVNGAGDAFPGPYRLAVTARAQGACGVRVEDVRMAWRACDPGLDCYEGPDDSGQLARFLRLPTTGPVVKEAHLVTVADALPGGWPASSRDGLDAHYALSEAATGYVMDRREPWAPEGEGGSRWGQSAYSRPLPVIDEAWYVNMFWSPRPAAGTRMIVRNPANGRAVVAAAGYETGPGANTAIGGVSEEIHDYLGTDHRDALELGFAEDQTLAFGPIDCAP